MTIKQRPEVHRHGSCYTTPRSWRPCSTAKKSFWRSRACMGTWAQTTVGAYLITRCELERFDLFWWRDGDPPARLAGTEFFSPTGQMQLRKCPPDWRALSRWATGAAQQVADGARCATSAAHSPGHRPANSPRDDQRVCRTKAVTLLATRTTTSSATAMSTMVPPGLRPR